MLFECFKFVCSCVAVCVWLFVCFCVADELLEFVGVLLWLMNSYLPVWLLNCLNLCVVDG